MKFKYFTYEEFDSPDFLGSGELVSNELISMLDVARKKYGKSMAINSGYRTIENNAKVGGKPTSSHLKGLAADISCTNSTDRFLLEGILREVGFTRIGIGNSFIHVDIDKDKAQKVLWTY
ncbi:D-Ala-D-Ala carboxypeptidase family metallohydrolase [Gammaproteobacteria bacterium]|nr:D-Ala-D-Ala carboxypeptidase family metallohydrolase [Gammaproteobacteria bacterium]